MKILIIEDEPKTAAFLEKGLSENGFATETAADGEQGLQLALGGKCDLIILDLMLPVRDGWSVLTELKKQSSHVPVLVLTARDAVQDRVSGLEMGADDYLVKPFAFSELLARVRSILRRSSSRRPAMLKVGDLEMDLVAHRASRGGARLELTPKEFALLSLLARHTAEVLSRAFIAREVWEMNFDCGTNVVDVHIRRLRSKLDDPYPRKLVHTVRGVGYVLEERS
jgi:two-component system copper resistance phosphate regulon response regulator CusR